MIDNLHIKGFQKHKDKFFEFHSGVNVITGTSDSGKSSVIRALKWLFFNKPSGDAFRNYDLSSKKPVTVTAKLKNKKISRIKGKENEYRINKKIYKALRSDVPDEIKNLTKMQGVNLQSQHPDDQYFLLTESPGQVAKKFNEVIGLDIMDKSLYRINSKCKKNNTELLSIDKEIKSKREEYKSLNWIPKAKEAITEIQKEETKIQEKEQKTNKILSIIEYIKKSNEKLKKYENLNKADSFLESLIIIKNETQKKQDEINNLNKAIQNLIQAETRLKGYIPIPEAENALNDLISFKNEIKKNQDKMNLINMRIIKRKNLQDKIANLEKEINKKEKIFHEQIKNKCPVCGRSDK